jgi:hypothetical protein
VSRCAARQGPRASCGRTRPGPSRSCVGGGRRQCCPRFVSKAPGHHRIRVTRGFYADPGKFYGNTNRAYNMAVAFCDFAGVTSDTARASCFLADAWLRWAVVLCVIVFFCRNQVAWVSEPVAWCLASALRCWLLLQRSGHRPHAPAPAPSSSRRVNRYDGNVQAPRARCAAVVVVGLPPSVSRCAARRGPRASCDRTRPGPSRSGVGSGKNAVLPAVRPCVRAAQALPM